ncbi:hypothetical protein XELAEV_18003115mg [Xenopus laevis]|uniref:Uncharacterized protein n=1 Tax=Xenopus laevis TaxID=8355 RepID=A0A974BPW0_XENLA|nr:hypothetical protein XELAEV_18003115mg [Xenopus laevis]
MKELCFWILSTLKQCIFKAGMIIIVKIATLRDFYDTHLALLDRWFFKFPLIPLRSTKISIGLFSREGESQYSWLIDKLQSKRRCIEYVQPFQISNSNGWQFQETRGRINITDVTDALYDEELDTLSKNLGETLLSDIIISQLTNDNSDSVSDLGLEV